MATTKYQMLKRVFGGSPPLFFGRSPKPKKNEAYPSDRRLGSLFSLGAIFISCFFKNGRHIIIGK
jgi:hypothetical protein